MPAAAAAASAAAAAAAAAAADDDDAMHALGTSDTLLLCTALLWRCACLLTHHLPLRCTFLPARSSARPPACPQIKDAPLYAAAGFIGISFLILVALYVAGTLPA